MFCEKIACFLEFFSRFTKKLDILWDLFLVIYFREYFLQVNFQRLKHQNFSSHAANKPFKRNNVQQLLYSKHKI